MKHWRELQAERANERFTRKAVYILLAVTAFAVEIALLSY